MVWNHRVYAVVVVVVDFKMSNNSVNEQSLIAKDFFSMSDSMIISARIYMYNFPLLLIVRSFESRSYFIAAPLHR